MTDSTEREASSYLDCQKPTQWRRIVYPARPLLCCWMSLGQIWSQSQNMEKLLAMLHFLEHSSTIAVSVSLMSFSGLSPWWWHAQDPHLNRAVRIACTIYTCNHRSPVARPLIFWFAQAILALLIWDSSVISKYITHVPDSNPLYMWHLLSVCLSQGERSLICGFPTGFFFIPKGVF